MPLWMHLNLRQKAVYEITQAPAPSEIPYIPNNQEVDFLLRGMALGPHRDTILPRLVDRESTPFVIDEAVVPGISSRRIRVRYYGADPHLDEVNHPYEPNQEERMVLETHVGWRWLYSSWKGPLVDEVVDADEMHLWPRVFAHDWSWEDGINFRPPPYHVSEDGLAWRAGLDAGLLGVGLQKSAIKRNLGKGCGRGAVTMISEDEMWESGDDHVSGFSGIDMSFEAVD